MKPRATHTDFRKGTKVRILFRDGETTVDKFLQSKSGRIQFHRLGWLKVKTIRRLIINKEKER